MYIRKFCPFYGTLLYRNEIMYQFRNLNLLFRHTGLKPYYFVIYKEKCLPNCQNVLFEITGRRRILYRVFCFFFNLKCNCIFYFSDQVKVLLLILLIILIKTIIFQLSTTHKPNLARALAKSYQELRSCKYLQDQARWFLGKIQQDILLRLSQIDGLQDLADILLRLSKIDGQQDLARYLTKIKQDR